MRVLLKLFYYVLLCVASLITALFGLLMLFEPETVSEEIAYIPIAIILMVVGYINAFMYMKIGCNSDSYYKNNTDRIMKRKIVKQHEWDNLQAEIRLLFKRVWELEHPPKLKPGDKVDLGTIVSNPVSKMIEDEYGAVSRDWFYDVFTGTDVITENEEDLLP